MKTMNFPVYTLDTVQGQMSFGYRREHRKWTFTLGTDSLLLSVHGAEQGHKIARIIAGSLKRCGKMRDALATANIKKMLGE